METKGHRNKIIDSVSVYVCECGTSALHFIVVKYIYALQLAIDEFLVAGFNSITVVKGFDAVIIIYKGILCGGFFLQLVLNHSERLS